MEKHFCFWNTKRANVQNLMRQLTRQLMSINGETFLTWNTNEHELIRIDTQKFARKSLTLQLQSDKLQRRSEELQRRSEELQRRSEKKITVSHDINNKKP